MGSIRAPLLQGSKQTVTVAASGASGGLDKDAFTFICKQNKKQKGCAAAPFGTCTTIPPPPANCAASSVPDSACPKNGAGGPDEVIFTVLGEGTDLDIGWAGTSHNFPVPQDWNLKLCLSGCDAGGATPCTANGPTGAGSLNTDVFGSPLPLTAGDVPICVLNLFSEPVTGMVNAVTGEMTGTVDLQSQVFVTDATKVCPRCETGTCDSGVNRGRSCHVDGQMIVVNTLAPNKIFHLSKDCPPVGSPVATLTISLPLTTGTTDTPGTGGSAPCTENQAAGLPVQDDDCGAAGCGTGNCTGDACVSLIPDPSNPSELVCVDRKGGLAQTCCNNSTSTPCFPTRPGEPGIIRTGRAVPPTTIPGATAFPKLSHGEVTVATFCEAATGSSGIDVIGLPGPGAVIFNTDACWLKAP